MRVGGCSSFFLFQAFRMFQLLLKYHDPQLALFLESHDFVPELYTPAWLLTLYCRALPMDMALGVWDMLLAADDPAFAFFVGIGLLLEHKDKILMTEAALIPEIISKATFKTSTDFRRTIQLSWTLYRKTPRCFLRLLRLCCVGSTDLTPSPDAVNKRRLQEQKQQEEEREGAAKEKEGQEGSNAMHASSVGEKAENHDSTATPCGEEKDKHSAQKLQLSQQDMALVQQSARHCLTMTAQELVSILLPSKGEQKATDSEDGQIVLLDVRSQEEINITGAGTLPKAISLEPNFLEHPAAFHKEGQEGSNAMHASSVGEKAENHDSTATPCGEEKDKHSAQKLQLSQQDMALVQQSARHCLTMTAQELVSILLPSKGEQKATDSEDGQIVLLDVRSQEEINITGAGTLPKAISLEPDFLEHPAAFHQWLEHFDGTRGCRICIIDMGNSRMKPRAGQGGSSTGIGKESQTGDIALWRRLLLGEGDGDAGAQRNGAGKKGYARDKHLDAHLKEMQATGRVSRGVDDVSTQDGSGEDVRELTASTAAENALKPSVHFAQILLSETFKYVSVLEGGYPALVQRLMQQKGRLEPLVINHDTARWADYVHRTGSTSEGQRTSSSSSSSSFAAKHINEKGNKHDHDTEYVRLKKASDMTEIDKLVYAMRFAKRAKHDTAFSEMGRRLLAVQMQPNL